MIVNIISDCIIQNEVSRSETHSFFVTAVDVYKNNPNESRTIPITSRGTTNFNEIVDANLQKFFDNVIAEDANNKEKLFDNKLENNSETKQN